MNRIVELCKQYTSLTDEEIEIITSMAVSLQPIANLEEADVFVDCPTSDGDAIVVAEAKPQGVPSSYKKTVVGLLAKPENEPAVARTMKLGVTTKQMKAVTQESTHVIQSVEPISHAGKVIGVLIIEKHADEQQRVRERLHFSEQSFERMAQAITHMTDENNWLPECIDEALLIVNRAGVVTFRNSLAHELYTKLGYVDDILGQKYENIRLTGSVRAECDPPEGYSAVETIVGQYSLSIKRIQIQSGDIAFAIIMRDITFMREQEKQLILKSVAIKEMHHRVKNNLQTIASLLRLQIRRSGNEITRRVLTESMNRILSIAATHELLAQSGVDQVMIGEVIVNIKNNAVRYFAPQHLELSISLEGDDFKVDSDIATSVALVINELLQNSLKYAFVGRKKGRIRILVTGGELYSCIEVTDDGCGFDINKINNDRLGLSIVQTLVKDKLRGKLAMDSNSNGTHVSFDFKNQIMDLAGVT